MVEGGTEGQISSSFKGLEKLAFISGFKHNIHAWKGKAFPAKSLALHLCLALQACFQNSDSRSTASPFRLSSCESDSLMHLRVLERSNRDF